MKLGWDVFDSKPLDKWVDRDSLYYKNYHAIRVKAIKTFGAGTYEKEDIGGSLGSSSISYVSNGINLDNNMKKILGSSGSIEIYPNKFEVYLHTYGQNAINRKPLFDRVVMDMKKLGYNNISFISDSSPAYLYFGYSTYSFANFEKAIIALDACLRRHFQIQ